MAAQVSFQIASKEERRFITRLLARVMSTQSNYEYILSDCLLEPAVLKIIVMSQNNPLGFAMIRITQTVKSGYGKVDLLAMAIAPEHQKQGIGINLLSYIESVAMRNGLRKLQANIPENNIEVSSFFLKAGYRIVYDNSDYYSEGQALLRMVKILKKKDFN